MGVGKAVHSPEPMAHKRECECFWVVVLWLGKAHKKRGFIVHPLLVGEAEAVKTNPKIGTQTADSGSRNSSPSQPVKVAQTGILVRSGTPTETSRLKNQTPRAADFRQTWQSISGPWVCRFWGLILESEGLSKWVPDRKSAALVGGMAKVCRWFGSV